MYSSSVYSTSRPSTAKTHRQDVRHAAAAAASAWSSAVAFDRRVLSRTVALAQTVSKGVLPEGWPRRRFCDSNAMLRRLASHDAREADSCAGQEQLTSFLEHLTGAASAPAKGPKTLRDKLQDSINVADLLAGRYLAFICSDICLNL